jgi:hypothetical protein
MREAYQADKVDRGAIEKSVKQVSDMQSQLKLNFVDFWFGVNNILTPEQQKAWKEHIGGMGPRFGAGFRGRMPMGRGRMMHRPMMDQDSD